MRRNRIIALGLSPLVLIAAVATASCQGDNGDEGAPPDQEGLPDSESSGTVDAGGGAVDDDMQPDEDGGASDTSDAGSFDAGPPDAGDACLRILIKTPNSLNVRKEASTSAARLASLFDGEIVERHATVTGESVNGSTDWYQVKLPAVTGYVHSSFAQCTSEPLSGPAGGYYLPFACDETRRVTQGNNSSFSHNGASRYAFDFSLGIGTPMLAMAPGTVKYVYDKTKPGDYCYDGKLDRAACIDKANLVNVLHGDGTVTQYAHLSKVSVKVGDKVKRGQQVGLSGSTGYSSGPHAHIVRAENCTSPFCQSVALSFVEASVPTAGQDVKSKNCPK